METQFVDELVKALAPYFLLVFGIIGFNQMIKSYVRDVFGAKVSGVFLILGSVVLGLIAGLVHYADLNWGTGIFVGFAAGGLAGFMPKAPEPGA